MTKHHFSIKEVFGFGWAKTKQHAWFIVLTFIIAFIIMSAVNKVPFVNILVSLMVGLSLASLSLQISRDHSFTFHDLYSPLLSQKRVLKFIALSILYGIPCLILGLSVGLILVGAASGYSSVVVFGTILMALLAVPTVYLGVRFKFFPYVVIENEHASIKDLIHMSYKLTDGQFWPLFAFLILLGVFNFIGAMLFIVGLAITVPVSLFASAHVYNKLKAHGM
jgi:hypothetical protein